MRSYLELQYIELKKLIVNANNDRHGPKQSEADAINWLFENHGGQMSKLAKDIVVQKGIFDLPLVKPDSKGFLIFDGNRRITCLKLLAKPEKAPEKYRKFFTELSSEANFTEETPIGCQIESDQKVIDTAINRRGTSPLC